MDILLKAHNRKIYTRTFIGLVLLTFFILNLLFLLGGLIFHNQICLLNTRTNFVYYKNLQSRLNYGISSRGWQPIELQSRYGYMLTGTYIPNPIPSNRTIVFLHGISSIQAMGLHFEDIYLNQGYNLLIYDSRGHGASGGPCSSWGYYEKYDLDQWIDWLYAKNPKSIVGVHGISMGAATALMHASLNESTKRVEFYIADSAYDDFTSVILQNMLSLTQSKHPIWIAILLKYASLVASFQSGFSYEDVSPIKDIAKVTTPILYLHGEADTLVPLNMSYNLYHATKGYREIHTFPGVKHGKAALERKYEYYDIVTNFLHSVN